MATATWIRNLLEQRGVAFEEKHHREVFTAQEVAQDEHVSGHRLAKVVVVIADGRPFELVIPASRRVVLEKVQQMFGARQVMLASEAEWTGFSTTSRRATSPHTVLEGSRGHHG